MVDFQDIAGYRIKNKEKSRVEQPNLTNLAGSGNRIIFFPAEFGGYAIDVLIDNTSAVASMQYRVNSRSTDLKTISISGVSELSETKVVMLEIVATGTWELQFNIVGSGIEGALQ